MNFLVIKFLVLCTLIEAIFTPYTLASYLYFIDGSFLENAFYGSFNELNNPSIEYILAYDMLSRLCIYIIWFQIICFVLFYFL